MTGLSAMPFYALSDVHPVTLDREDPILFARNVTPCDL
jgi:hypothetical protein